MKNLLKVVVVDDEPLARKGMLMRLTAFPELQVVAECSNGAEAIKAVQELAPDVVFLDVEMPFGNAFDVLEACKDLHFETIFVTAFSGSLRLILKIFFIAFLPVLPFCSKTRNWPFPILVTSPIFPVLARIFTIIRASRCGGRHASRPR